MINNELLKFVKDQLDRNVPKEQIVAILKPGGWTDADVNEALQALQTPAVPLLKVFPKSGADLTSRLPLWVVLVSVLFLLIMVGGGLWYFLSRGSVSTTPTQKQLPASEAGRMPPIATSTPAIVGDQDLMVSWTKIQDDQNIARAMSAIAVMITASDKDFLSKYFGKGYDIKNLPAVSVASAVAARNVKALQVFSAVSVAPLYQCSTVMTLSGCDIQALRDIGRLLLLRSYVLERAGKNQDALAIVSNMVDLGRKVTSGADEVLTLLAGWELQKNGYQRMAELNQKVSAPFNLSADDKTGRLNTLRTEQKNIFKYLYTRESEALEYLADKNKLPSFPQLADDIAAADEYRKSITLGKFNLAETKGYFYNSYKISMNNVDLACGSRMMLPPYDFNSEMNIATTTGNQKSVGNYIGKVLYWTTYTPLDNINIKRCEVEELINKL